MTRRRRAVSRRIRKKAVILKSGKNHIKAALIDEHKACACSGGGCGGCGKNKGPQTLTISRRELEAREQNLKAGTRVELHIPHHSLFDAFILIFLPLAALVLSISHPLAVFRNMGDLGNLAALGTAFGVFLVSAGCLKLLRRREKIRLIPEQNSPSTIPVYQ